MSKYNSKFMIYLFVFSLIVLVIGNLNTYAFNEQAPIKLVLSHCNFPGDTVDTQVQYFAKLVEEASFGEIQIEVIPGGQLFSSEVEGLEASVLGTHPLAKFNLGALTQYSDTVNALDLPFLFKDHEHVAATMHGPLGEKVNNWVLEETGNIRILAWFTSGFQCFYTNKPIRNIEDMKGMTMRVMDSPARRDSMNAYGAMAVAIPWQECYGAFQQGVADGAENAISLIHDSRQYEVLPYISDSNHFFSFNLLSINEEFFQSLSKEHQNIITRAAKLMESWGQKYFVREEEKKKEQLLGYEGVEFINLDPGAREKFRAAAFTVWKKYANTPRKKEIIETLTGVTF